jgi:uncharacterized lipoprotein YddW (UPF0748 family)
MWKKLQMITLIFFVLSAAVIHFTIPVLAVDYVHESGGQQFPISGYNIARGTNQLIVYTPANASSTTGTSALGIEIVVVNNLVTEIRDGKVDGSKNATIPSNGFVLSGHGTATDSPYVWLKTNISLGERIDLSVVPSTPNVTADDVSNVISGANSTMEYSINGGTSYTTYIVATPPTFAGDQTVLVRFAASGVNQASLPTSLTFTTNPVIIPPVPAGLMADYVKESSGQLFPISGYDMPRGTNQLIVYTPAYSSATTGTNALGIEVVVRNHIVTEIRDGKVEGTKSAAIPSDGFVLSGHGSAANSPYIWLKSNITLGENIDILKDQILNPSYSVSSTLLKKNPTAPFQFPGGRGSGELVYYDAAYGYPTTGTNEFGYEIVVENGIVVKVGGNDSTIPVNGFVLSGHGASKTFLQNAQVGAEVTVVDYNVTIILSAQSYLRAAQMRIDEAVQKLSNAVSSFLDIDQTVAQQRIDLARQQLIDAQTAYDQGLWTDAAGKAVMAANTALSAIYGSIESKVVDGRGIWYVPTESSPLQVAATLDRIQAAGINMVFLQTIYRGYAIFPNSSEFKQNPSFIGWDPLEAFVTQGHKRGIEIHAWVHTFYTAKEGEDPVYPQGPILAEHPEWAALDRNLQMKTTLESDHYYISQGNPEAKDFLANGFLEMTHKYALDGLQLDYIRFPVSSTVGSPYEKGYTYDTVTRNRVVAELGFDPLYITPSDNPVQWEQWVNWRKEQVTGFVKRISEGLPAQMLLSTAVFPEEDVSLTKFQDWSNWADHGYLDLITPMVYKTDEQAVAHSSELFNNKMKGKVYTYVGLGPYLDGFDPYLLNKQIDDVNILHISGSSLFSLNSITQIHLDAVKFGPYRNIAVTPHSGNGIDLLANELIRKINAIYSPNSGISTQDADEIKAKLSEIVQKQREIQEPGSRYLISLTMLNQLQVDVLNRQNQMNTEVYKRIQESVAYMLEIAMIKLKQTPDAIAPVTTDDAPTSWVNKATTVNLFASDNNTGVANTYFIVDGGVQETGSTVVIEAEGVHSVAYWSVDKGGNVESQHVVSVKIDLTAPSATVNYSTTASTNKDVIATMTPSEPVTITNNGGLSSYTFAENGSFTFNFVDAAGNQGSVTTIVSNIDRIAPTAKITLNQNDLNPPNHKMVPIHATLTSQDNNPGSISIILKSITSNEPDNGLGDGDTPNDIQGADFGTLDTDFMLRAERSGKGDDRIYTITYTITDEAGNQSSAIATVVVKHDSSKS